jgi:hypothetical protein
MSERTIEVDELIELGSHVTFRTYLWRENVSLTVWHSTPDVETAQKMLVVTRRLFGTPTRKLAVVQILAGKVGIPDGPCRLAMLEAQKLSASSVSAVSTVIYQDTLLMAAFRTFIAGMNVFARGVFDFGVHGNYTESAQWTANKHQHATGIRLPSELLGAAMQHIQPAPFAGARRGPARA